MGTDGSERHAAHPVVALAALCLGAAAMLTTARLTLAWGLRPMILLAETALALPGLLAAALRPVPWRTSLALWPLARRQVLLVLGAGASLWVASLGLFELQAAVWPPDPDYLEGFRRLHAALHPTGPVDALISIAAIAIVPALCEESLLRGILLPSLARPLGAGLGVLVSALLFAFVHFDMYRFAFTFAVGIALGALRLRAGSLLAPVLAHATLNTITFAAAPFADDPTADTASPLLGACLLALGAAVAWAALRRVRPAPESVDSLRGRA